MPRIEFEINLGNKRSDHVFIIIIIWLEQKK